MSLDRSPLLDMTTCPRHDPPLIRPKPLRALAQAPGSVQGRIVVTASQHLGSLYGL
jgi:hypothetical protein